MRNREKWTKEEVDYLVFLSLSLLWSVNFDSINFCMSID